MSIEITKGDSLKEWAVYKDDCEVFTSVSHSPGLVSRVQIRVLSAFLLIRCVQLSTVNPKFMPQQSQTGSQGNDNKLQLPIQGVSTSLCQPRRSPRPRKGKGLVPLKSSTEEKIWSLDLLTLCTSCPDRPCLQQVQSQWPQCKSQKDMGSSLNPPIQNRACYLASLIFCRLRGGENTPLHSLGPRM